MHGVAAAHATCLPECSPCSSPETRTGCSMEHSKRSPARGRQSPHVRPGRHDTSAETAVWLNFEIVDELEQRITGADPSIRQAPQIRLIRFQTDCRVEHPRSRYIWTYAVDEDIYGESEL